MKTALVIDRSFEAPRERLWQAWSDPELMKCWFGPKTFTTPFCTIDFRVGGKNITCMRSPEGQDFWSTGEYREIIPMEKIVCTDSFADEKGNAVSGEVYGMGKDFPLEMLVIVTLEEQGGKTKMTMVHEGMPPGEHMDGARGGWNESFDKLEDCLKRLE